MDKTHANGDNYENESKSRSSTLTGKVPSMLFRSRLYPLLFDALTVIEVRTQFAAFLSFRGAASLLRFWIEADARLKSASIEATTNEAAARKIAENCSLGATILSKRDFEKGVPHCQFAVAEELQNRFFDDFKQSSYYASYQLDLLQETLLSTNVNEGERLQLDDIVFFDKSLFQFREFLEMLPDPNQSSILLSMLNFYLAAASFGREYRLETAMADALNLYEQYLSLNAVRPLGLPDSVRRSVELGISVETGQPSPQTFDPATDHVRKLLSGEGILGQFFHSEPFHEMFQEIRRKATENSSPSSLNGKRHSSNLSNNTDQDDTSSQHSTSSRASSSLRRVQSLTVARIDGVTGAYVSEFKNPANFEVNDSVSLPVASDKGIRRIFSLKGENSSREQLRKKMQEEEAERKAAEIIEEINAAIASVSPCPTPRSSGMFE